MRYGLASEHNSEIISWRNKNKYEIDKYRVSRILPSFSVGALRKTLQTESTFGNPRLNFENVSFANALCISKHCTQFSYEHEIKTVFADPSLDLKVSLLDIGWSYRVTLDTMLHLRRKIFAKGRPFKNFIWIL